MQTRRYPRTMNEAFGPYTSRKLHPMTTKGHRTGVRPDVVVYCIVLVALVLTLALEVK